MSNYGFKTLEKNGAVAINGKWPIFGADINHQPAAFRTIRITDRKTNALRYGNVALPSVNPNAHNYWQYPQTQDTGEIKELVYRYEHGYDHRPVGYWTIGGTMNFRTSGDMSVVDTSGDLGGGFNGSTNGALTRFPLVSLMNRVFAGTYSDFGSVASVAVRYSNNASSGSIVIPDRIPNSYSGVYMPNLGEAGYKVEIDDKYVSIYRVNYWFDVRRRAYINYNDSGISFTMDSNARVRGVTQLEGSVVDVNIYLTPLDMEKL